MNDATAKGFSLDYQILLSHRERARLVDAGKASGKRQWFATEDAAQKYADLLRAELGADQVIITIRRLWERPRPKQMRLANWPVQRRPV
jgi:hypothetical protein